MRLVQANYEAILRGEAPKEYGFWAVPKTENNHNDVCGGADGQTNQ